MPTCEHSLGSRHGRTNALAAWIVYRRRSVLLFSLVVAGLASVGILRLEIRNDTRVFLRKESRDYQAFHAFEETFGRTDLVVFLLAPEGGTVFSPRAAQALTALTDAASELPNARQVNSLARFRILRQEGDALSTSPLLESFALETDEGRAEARNRAGQDGAVDHRLVSAEGDVAGVYVTLDLPDGGSGMEPEIVAAAHHIAGTIRAQYPDMDIRPTGPILLADAFGELSRRELRRRVPLVFFVMTVVLGFSLRSLSGLFTAVSAIILSVATGLGLAGWLGIPLTALSVSGPGLIATLAVADCVHLLGGMLRHLRAGATRTSAVQAAFRNSGRAVFLTTATTAIGFFSLNVAELPPLRHLGTIVGMGVLAALAFAVFFVPALMSILPAPPVRATMRPAGSLRMARFAAWVIRRPRPILAGMALGVGVAVFGLLRIELDDNYYEYLDRSFDVRRTTDYWLRTLGGNSMLEYAFESGETHGIFEPDYLRTIDRFASWIRETDTTASVLTIADIFKVMNRELSDLEEERLPESREWAAQLLLLYEMGLPPDDSLASHVDLDRATSRVQVFLNNLSARELRNAERAAQAWLAENAPPALRPQGTGFSLLWANIIYRNTHQMLAGSLLALALISLLLGIPLRSLRLGLISLVPNLLPAILVLGLWGLFHSRIGLALSVVIAMTIGIVVDDTIHFLTQYQRSRRAGTMDAAESVIHVFRTTGVDLCTTTASLVAGFGVLAFSPYRMNAEIGLLCALVLCVALALDLLLLPTLLLWRHGSSRQGKRI